MECEKYPSDHTSLEGGAALNYWNFLHNKKTDLGRPLCGFLWTWQFKVPIRHLGDFNRDLDKKFIHQTFSKNALFLIFPSSQSLSIPILYYVTNSETVELQKQVQEEMWICVYQGMRKSLKTQTAWSNSHGESMNDNCSKAYRLSGASAA